MRSSILYKLAVVVLLAAAVQGCKKKSPLSIDNNQIIQKPYTLFAVDTIGAIWHSNDGELFTQVPGAGAGSGIHTRSVAYSDTNILFIQFNAFVSNDRGNNFNPISNETIVAYPHPVAVGQSMMLDVPSFDRLYMAGASSVIYSDSNGRMGTWMKDGINATSFTQLKDGNLIAYDDASKTTWMLPATNKPWGSTGSGGLPATGQFFINHFDNLVIAADYSGQNGVYFSNNNGASWTAFTGLPAGVPVISITSAFDQTLLVGTKGAGVYSVVPTLGTEFKLSSEGLTEGIEVHGLTAKSNLYKGGAIKQYIFAATNKGVYRSEDLGKNWVNVFDRNFVAIY